MSYSHTITMKEFSCSRKGCGVSFAIQGSVASVMERNHEAVWCPRGHQMKFSDETEMDRLKAESLRLESQLEFERERRRNAEATAKRERTRRTNVEKRVKNGVCPCCHRSFVALQRHMKTKHPDYAEAE